MGGNGDISADDVVVEQVGPVWFTECVHIPANTKGETASVNRELVVVPGNPGSVYYYLPLAQQLHENTGLATHALSLGGFHSDKLDSHLAHNCIKRVQLDYFHIEAQVDFVIGFLDNILAAKRQKQQQQQQQQESGSEATTTSDDTVYNRKTSTLYKNGKPVEDVKASQETTSIADTEFVLCGHSIGAWVDLTWKEFAQFHTMFFLRPVLSVAAYALSFCPRPIMKKLFSVFAKDVTSSEANVDATLKIVNFTGSRNALFMGETEFKTVPDKIDVTAFRTIAPKLTMYYADAQHHDHWAPSNQRKELAALLEGAGTTFQEFPYNHAFVLYADQVTGIAAAVKNRLPQIQ